MWKAKGRASLRIDGLLATHRLQCGRATCICVAAGAIAGKYFNWGKGVATPAGRGTCAATKSGAWVAEDCSGLMSWFVVEFEAPNEDVLVYLDSGEVNAEDPVGTWKDHTRFGHDATLVSEAAPVSFDGLSHTFHFDGTAAYEVPIDIGPNAYPQLTIEVWFKFDSDAPLDKTTSWIVGHDDGGYDRALILSDERFKGMGSGVGYAYDAGIGVPGKNQWHHAVAVFDYKKDKGSFVALDNVLGTRVTEASGAGHESGKASFTIGNLPQYAVGSHGFYGNIAMVKVWKKALSPAEITKAYQLFQEEYGDDEDDFFEIVDGSDNTDIPDLMVRGQTLADLRFDLDREMEGYRGCYKNLGGDRVNGHTWGKTYTDCRKEAIEKNKPFFGLEFPQGTRQDERAQCLAFDAMPDMDRTSNADCEVETDKAGHILGGANRLAMFAVGHTSNKFQDSSGGGKWSLWSGAYPLMEEKDLRPLKFSDNNQNGVVLGNSFLDMGANSKFKLPGVSSGALLGGPGEGKPDPDEVAIHPGDPKSDKNNQNLIIRWSPAVSGWYDLSGTARDLGVMNDGITLSMNWLELNTDATEVSCPTRDEVMAEPAETRHKKYDQPSCLVACRITPCGDTVPCCVKPNGGTPRQERIGLIKRDIQAFQHRLWVAKNSKVDIVIGPAGNFISDHAALTVVFSLAENFSPFNLNAKTTKSPPGAQILGWNRGMQLTGDGFTSKEGNNVQLSEDVPKLAMDTRSLKLTINDKSVVRNYVWFGANVANQCGDRIVMSAWVKFKGSVPKPGSNAGFKHHADEDKVNGAGDPPIDNSWFDDLKPDTWGFVTKTWTADYTTGDKGGKWPNGDHLLLIFDSLPTGTVVNFCDFHITKILPESEANLGYESTQDDITPDRFYVGGSNFNIPLTATCPSRAEVLKEPIKTRWSKYDDSSCSSTCFVNPCGTPTSANPNPCCVKPAKPAFTNSQGTITATFSADVPQDANDPRSIEFTVPKPGPFAWFGYQTTICKGDLVQFSVWLKFIGKVPTFDRDAGGGGIGLKHHAGNPDKTQEGDPQIYSDFLDTMTPNEWTLVTKTWRADYTGPDLTILIFDHAPAGTIGRFADLRITKLINTPVLFFRGGGDYVKFKSSTGVPVGNSPYTIEAWVNPHKHSENGIVGWGDSKDNTGTTLRLNKDGQVVHSWGGGSDLILTKSNSKLDAKTWVDDMWFHIAVTYDGTTRTIFLNGVNCKNDRPGKPHAAVAGELRIGSTELSNYFDGSIAEVRIWEVARSGDEINHYKDVEIDTAQEGLIGYWRMDDGGTTIRDDSPRKMNGLVIGARYNMHTSPPPLAGGFADFIVDTDAPRGILVSGFFKQVKTGGAFQGAGYLSDSNSGKGLSTVKVQINVPAPGTYDVWMSFPVKATNAPAVPVTIDHQSGSSTVIVDETKKVSEGYTLLGTFRFKAGAAFITVSNKGTNGVVVVDTFKLTKTNRPLDDITKSTWSEGCQTVSTNHAKGDFSYTTIQDTLPSTAITFSVKAANDAHIGFMAGPKEQKDMYEIVIGGWANTQSVIREQHQGKNMVTVKRNNLLSAQEARSFWVTFQAGLIVVGTGTQVSAPNTEFMRWQDPVPMVVDHIGVGTGFNSGGFWEVCAVTDGSTIGGGGEGGNSECPKGFFKLDVSPKPSCVPFTKCERGQFQSKAPTATKDRECSDCLPGTSDSDSNPITKCVRCSPGHYTPAKSFGPCTTKFDCQPGTYDDDRKSSTPCKACPANTYSPVSRSLKCRAVTAKCPKGQEQSQAPTPTVNRRCKFCFLGQTFNPVAGGACQPVHKCKTGETYKKRPTTSSDAECVAASGGGGNQCDPGNYQASGVCTPCAPGETDDDYDSSTSCVQCIRPGVGIFAPAQSVGPCEGLMCPAGTFGRRDPSIPCIPCIKRVDYQDEDGKLFCKKLSTCPSGMQEDAVRMRNYTSTNPTHDRPCRPCPSLSYKAAAGNGRCTRATDCGSGFQPLKAPTPVSDRVCSPCRPGYYKDSGMPVNGMCARWRMCPNGYEQSKKPTPWTDRECQLMATDTNQPAPATSPQTSTADNGNHGASTGADDGSSVPPFGIIFAVIAGVLGLAGVVFKVVVRKRAGSTTGSAAAPAKEGNYNALESISHEDDDVLLGVDN